MIVPDRLRPVFGRMVAGHNTLNGDLNWIAGWCYTESAFDPWALRYEPAFYDRYILPLRLSDKTEAKARAFSYGPFQIMGQVAREFGFTGRYLTQLCDPDINATLAARILADRQQRTGSWEAALAAYNGGLGGARRKRDGTYVRQDYVDKVARHRALFV